MHEIFKCYHSNRLFHDALLAIAQIFDNAVQAHECVMQKGYLSCPFYATVVRSQNLLSQNLLQFGHNPSSKGLQNFLKSSTDLFVITARTYAFSLDWP